MVRKKMYGGLNCLALVPAGTSYCDEHKPGDDCPAHRTEPGRH